VERCEAEEIGGIRVCARLQQNTDDLHVANASCDAVRGGTTENGRETILGGGGGF
jgi:hypothetical protein